MKLASKYHRINLLFTISIFVLASIAFYFLLQRVLTIQVDEDLRIEQREMTAWIAGHNRFPEMVTAVEDQQIHIRATGKHKPQEWFKTVKLYDEVDKKFDLFRQFQFGAELNGIWFEVRVSKSLEGSEKLGRNISFLAIIIIVVLLISLILINKLILQKLWLPFYQSIEKLRKFKFGNGAGLLLPLTKIEEFDLLNSTLTKAANKANSDFLVLKEFTENASHELQTPLAVVRSKLEILMQDQDLTQKQSILLNEAEMAIERMSRLNTSLLLLAKIENGQFDDGQFNLNLSELLEGLLRELEPIIQERQLLLDVSIQPAFLNIVPALAEILLTNLLSNSIYHNKQGGTLCIHLLSGSLSICNSSVDEELNAETLFRRFGRYNKTTRTGLGLAISKEICDKTACSMSYNFTTRNLHCFEVHWQELGN